jgi:hypothetical protein
MTLHGSRAGREGITQDETAWKNVAVCIDENTFSLWEGDFFCYF